MNVETQPGSGKRRSMSIALVTGPGSLVLSGLVCLLLCASADPSPPSKSKFLRVWQNHLLLRCLCCQSNSRFSCFFWWVDCGSGANARNSVEMHTAFGHNAFGLKVTLLSHMVYRYWWIPLEQLEGYVHLHFILIGFYNSIHKIKASFKMTLPDS